MGCAGTFQWCASGRKVEGREARWAPGSPQTTEACVSITIQEKISGKNSTLATDLCGQKKQFVCQANIFRIKKINILMKTHFSETCAFEWDDAGQLGVLRNLAIDGTRIAIRQKHKF